MRKTIVTKKEIREILIKYPVFLNWLIDQKALKPFVEETWKSVNTNPESLLEKGKTLPTFETKKECKNYLLKTIEELLEGNKIRFELNFVHFFIWDNTPQKWFFWNRLFMLALLERNNEEILLSYHLAGDWKLYSATITKDSF